MNYEDMLKRAKENIPVSEKGERFEMPEISVMQSGNQTIIKNFIEIAKKIRRDPKHVSKFLFKELAVPGSMRGNELVLQGKFDRRLITTRMNDYVKEFVTCQECGKIDSNLKKGERLIILKCEACGASRPVRNI